MKLILFDECVPRLLARSLRELKVRCDPFPDDWKQLSDSALLEQAAKPRYDILVTSDKNLVHQQNFSDVFIGLLVLTTNNWQQLRAVADDIPAVLRSMKANAKLQMDADGTVIPLEPSRPRGS